MIAIPNMEKPKCCAGCDWIAWSNLEQSDVCDRCEGRPIEDYEKVADFCPLIEIVRCKDCKHSKNCIYPAKWNWCPDGERRE